MTVTPEPKWSDVGCHHFLCDGTLLPIRPAQSGQLRVSRHVICTGTWELLSRFAWKQDAKMPACGQGGRRRRSSQRPACNGRDRVKVRQERGDRRATGLGIHDEVRQDLFLNRSWTRKGGDLVNQYVAALWKAGCGQTRTSGLEGGKAVRPYLSYWECHLSRALW
jgi:hypothetical protein